MKDRLLEIWQAWLALLPAGALFLLLAYCGRAEELYQIRRLSEPELLRTYTGLMRDACRHADQFWQDWPVEPQAGFWGSGRSDQMNEGIRAISEMVLTCGALVKYSDALSETERKEYIRKATAAIRYAVSSHRTGVRTCPDGKPWGGSWQSAMWTGTLGFGSWLLWDHLEPELQQKVERVVASEADRFLAGKPPGGSWADTKAEENGWNLICISLAANLFPHHPHAPAWNQKAIEYMMNTLSAPQDRQDKTLGIENDRLTGGKRHLFYQQGQTLFDWKNPQPPLSVPGSWANVDGRLGVVQVAGAGLSYVQAAGYHPQMAVCADLLYGSFSDRPKHFKAGEEVARRVMVLYVEVTPKKTSSLARACTLRVRPQGPTLRFKLPEGGQDEVPLSQ